MITMNLYRGITGLHKGVTVIHSSAARRRRRRVWNPMHAALIKGVGHSFFYEYSCPETTAAKCFR